LTRTQSDAAIPLADKARELILMLASRLKRPFEHPTFDDLFSNLRDYDESLRRYSNLRLIGAKVLEIGCGSHPMRLMAMLGMAIDAVGVDMDAPILRGSPSEIVRTWRANGAERALKSLARLVLSDWIDRRQLAAVLKRRGGRFVLPSAGRVIVADAAELRWPARSLDLIVSEDVFEHIDAAALPALVRAMSRWLKPGGIALIRPCIFTGICGSHLVEWQTAAPRSRRSEPWEHLRRRRYQPNVYLNQLSRSEYRELFRSEFEILEERDCDPGLGREFMTPSLRSELAAYSDEDLFSNHVMFVLRPSVPSPSTTRAPLARHSTVDWRRLSKKR